MRQHDSAEMMWTKADRQHDNDDMDYVEWKISKSS